MAETEDAVGQVDSETSIETTQTAPEGGEGQSVATEQTTSTGTDSEQTFIDPTTIPDELKPFYKEMQGAWTKKMQLIAKDREKISAYDKFAGDPLGTIKQLSQQYGYNLVQGTPQEKDWQPETWDDVMKKAKEEARTEVMGELQPLLNEVKSMKRTSVEQSLTEIDPQWRLYEDQMTETLEAHPSLVSDPEKLYRISVPNAVYEKRAYKKAIDTLNSKASEKQLSGGSQPNKKPTDKTKGPLSFDEAVAVA